MSKQKYFDGTDEESKVGGANTDSAQPDIIQNMNDNIEDMKVVLDKILETVEGKDITFAVKNANELPATSDSSNAAVTVAATDEEKKAKALELIDKYLETKIVIDSFQKAEDILYEKGKHTRECKKLAKGIKAIKHSDIVYLFEKKYEGKFTSHWKALPKQERSLEKNLLKQTIENKNYEIDRLKGPVWAGVMTSITIFSTGLLAFANYSMNFLNSLLEDAVAKKDIALVEGAMDTKMIDTASNLYMFITMTIVCALVFAMIYLTGSQKIAQRHKSIAKRQLDIIEELEKME